MPENSIDIVSNVKCLTLNTLYPLATNHKKSDLFYSQRYKYSYKEKQKKYEMYVSFLEEKNISYLCKVR